MCWLESGLPIIQILLKIWICVRIRSRDAGHGHGRADNVHLWEVLWLYTTLLHSLTDKLTSVTICNSDGYIQALTFSFVFVFIYILALSDHGVGEYLSILLYSWHLSCWLDSPPTEVSILQCNRQQVLIFDMNEFLFPILSVDFL